MKRLTAILLTLIMVLSAAMLSVTAAESNSSYPVAENVNGRKITVDGVMGADEGWSKDPMFQTHLAVREPDDTDGIKDKSPSTLRISCDGKKIYFFYEIFRPGMAESGWLGLNGGYRMPELNLYFAPEGKHLEEMKEADRCFVLNLRLFRENLMTGVTPIKGVTGSYKWDGSLSTDSKWQQNDDNWEHIFGYMYYGSTYATPTTSAQAKSYASYAGGYLQGTQIAIHRDYEEGYVTRLSLEIAVPISTELANQLKTGTANYRVGAYERSYRYDWAEAEWGGYILSDQLLSQNGDAAAPYNGNWMFTANCGATFTIPQAVVVNVENDQNDTNGTNDQNTENETETTVPTDTLPAPIEPGEVGCGSVIGAGSAITVLAIVSCAGVACFKKRD